MVKIDYVEARVCNFPQVINGEVVFVCWSELGYLQCISNDKHKVYDLIFLKPGHIVQICGNLNQRNYYKREKRGDVNVFCNRIYCMEIEKIEILDVKEDCRSG